ncbi:unnamed protein product [Calypogeia fissa]
MEEVEDAWESELPENMELTEQRMTSVIHGGANSTTTHEERRRRILIAICINLVLQIMTLNIYQAMQSALVTTTNFMTLMHWLVEYRHVF